MRQKITERVVTIGGGTGSFTILSALKKVATQLWAVIAMTDSGGSSRRLIDEFGQPLPLGDLRQALVAMSRSSKLWGDIFSYRFPDAPGGGVGGHALGNLILHALQDFNEGDLVGALEDAEELLNTAGHVLPVTLASTTLCAELEDGTIVRGETVIDQAGERPVLPIKRIYLDPPINAAMRARKALERADKIVIGTGDLYTSVLACLLPEHIGSAIRASSGEIIYICNVMTKHGETDGFAASNFVREVHRYLGRRVDTVIVNTGAYPAEQVARYAAQGSYPVEADLDKLRELVPRVITGTFFSAERLIRHDAERVLLAIWPELNE